MHRFTWKTFVLTPLLVAAPLVLACGGGETGGGMETGEGGGAQPGMESGAQSEVVEWTALNDSGVTGDVELSVEGSTLEVAVLANSLGGPGDYPSHIHSGTCAEPGGVVVALNPATAHEPGIGEAETEVDLSELEAGQSYLVMVHALQGQPVACAEIPQDLLASGS